MRIKKVSQTTTTQAQIVDGYSESKIDGYSCNYINDITNINISFDTPTKTGRRFKINDKWYEEYIISHYLGTLPNKAGTTNYSTNIDSTNMAYITSTGGTIYNNAVYFLFNLPRYQQADFCSVSTTFSNNELIFAVECGRDRSSFYGICWCTYLQEE